MKNKFIYIFIVSLLAVIILCLVLFIYPNISDNEIVPLSYDVNKSGDNMILSNYSEYRKVMDKYNFSYDLSEKNFDENRYVLIFVDYDSCGEEIIGVSVTKNTKDKVNVEIEVNDNCGGCANLSKMYLIPIDVSTSDSANIEIKNRINYSDDCNNMIEKKPIIYLYPEVKTDVIVKLGYPENITSSYPKYDDGWNVTAYPDGTLIDKNNKKYYALYWEGKINSKNTNTGFVVKKDNLVSFLEEKLEILGLNYKEREEFIVYWLPELEKNDYNYIYFMSDEEINENMPLNVSPEPDSIIRVWMKYKKVDSNYKVIEEKLTSPKRDGFTVVEWGGTKID